MQDIKYKYKAEASAEIIINLNNYHFLTFQKLINFLIYYKIIHMKDKRKKLRRIMV